MRRTVDKDGNWRAFRHRNFRILFPANALSNIGTWAQRVAQDWLVLELTNNNGAALGLVTAVQFAPVLFLSLHGGVLADRFRKRNLLLWTNSVAGLSALALGCLVIGDVIELWHVLFFAGVLGVSSALDSPVRQAFTSEIVGDSDVSSAISLNSANFHAGRLIGPAISGLLIAKFGTGPSFIINAATYVAVIIAMASMRENDFFIEKKEKTLGTIREGIQYTLARPDLYVVMLLIFFIATFALNFQVFNALMAAKAFNKGPASFGLLGTFIAIGSLSGALLSGRLQKLHSPLFVIKFAHLVSIAVIILSIAPTYLWYSIWLPICGVTALTTLISANSYVQTRSDPAIRGRIMGIYLLIFLGGTPFGSLLIGWMTETIGVRQTVAACGGISLAAALTIWVIYRDRVEEPADLRVSSVLG